MAFLAHAVFLTRSIVHRVIVVFVDVSVIAADHVASAAECCSVAAMWASGIVDFSVHHSAFLHIGLLVDVFHCSGVAVQSQASEFR